MGAFDEEGEKHLQKTMSEDSLDELRTFQCSLEPALYGCAASKDAPCQQESFIERLAGIAYGRHEYKINTVLNLCPFFSVRRDKAHARTIEGGLCVSMATAILLSKQQIGSGKILALVPFLVVLIEIHLPHQSEETNIALFIIFIDFVLRLLIVQ